MAHSSFASHKKDFQNTIDTRNVIANEEKNRIFVLKNAIQEGENSGIALDFEPNIHLESLKSMKSSVGLNNE